MNFDPNKDQVFHCTRCNAMMIVTDYKVRKPIDEYLDSIGAKPTGRFICSECASK